MVAALTMHALIQPSRTNDEDAIVRRMSEVAARIMQTNGENTRQLVQGALDSIEAFKFQLSAVEDSVRTLAHSNEDAAQRLLRGVSALQSSEKAVAKDARAASAVASVSVPAAKADHGLGAPTHGRAVDPFDTQYVKNTCVPCGDPSLKRYGPHAYIVGVEKGGTSALKTYLQDHPEIVPHMKETYVLQSTYNQRYGYGKEGGPVDQCRVFQLYKEWYQKDGSIDDVERGLKYIDKTPYYIFAGPHVAQRLLCADPHAKMIVLLRNPVDRAYSEYNVSARDATTLSATRCRHAAMHGCDAHERYADTEHDDSHA